jgi:hypothetical protein
VRSWEGDAAILPLVGEAEIAMSIEVWSSEAASVDFLASPVAISATRLSCCRVHDLLRLLK